MKTKSIVTLLGIVAWASIASAWTHSPSSKTVAANGETFTLTVSGTENYEWSAGATVDWISVSRIDAKRFKVTVAANTNSENRGENVCISAFRADAAVHNAASFVNMAHCGISQAGTGTSGGGGSSSDLIPASVNPMSIVIGMNACTTSITVKADSTWTASSEDLDWIHLNVSQEATNYNGTVNVTIDANPNRTRRAGTILVAGQAVYIAQRKDAPCGITNVKAKQRYPFSDRVDIDYTVFGNIKESANESKIQTALNITAIDQDSGHIFTATNLTGDCSLEAGEHSIVWDMGADNIEFFSTNVVFRVTCKTNALQYCVVDVSSGSNADSYSVTWLPEKPSQEWPEEYKLSKIALRRVENGTFHVTAIPQQYYTTTNSITLTQPFYMAIYEMTQKQFQLITGEIGLPKTGSYDTWISAASDVCYEDCVSSDDKCPAICSYTKIRGGNWPLSGDAVDPDTVMSTLRKRTNMAFDLPTGAQWLKAYKAGTTTSHYWGDWDLYNDPQDYSDYAWGRLNSNCTTHEVGLKIPNALGLYDMAGNIAEWCLDASPQYFGTDPVGTTCKSAYGFRLRKGGDFWDGEIDMASYYTACLTSNGWCNSGIRLTLTVPEFQLVSQCCSSTAMQINTRDPKDIPIITATILNETILCVAMSWENDWPI